METVKASIVEEEDRHFIIIGTDAENIRIPISDDRPREVQNAFNKLIERIKEGQFVIVLEVEGEDLFFQVAKEYITQLNREIAEVREEMIQYGLIKDRDEAKNAVKER